MDQKQIGQFIKVLRKQKQMTQAELGRQLGVTNKTISRWENGNYMPDISVLPQLCVILGISVNELISGQRLNDNNFRQSADNNLVSSLKQLKYIRHQKHRIEFLGGSGTGILISAIYSPDTIRKVIVIIIGIILILLSWYFQHSYHQYVENILGPDEHSDDT